MLKQNIIKIQKFLGFLRILLIAKQDPVILLTILDVMKVERYSFLTASSNSYHLYRLLLPYFLILFQRKETSDSLLFTKSIVALEKVNLPNLESIEVTSTSRVYFYLVRQLISGE